MKELDICEFHDCVLIDGQILACEEGAFQMCDEAIRIAEKNKCWVSVIWIDPNEHEVDIICDDLNKIAKITLEQLIEASKVILNEEPKRLEIEILKP